MYSYIVVFKPIVLYFVKLIMKSYCINYYIIIHEMNEYFDLVLNSPK